MTPEDVQAWLHTPLDILTTPTTHGDRPMTNTLTTHALLNMTNTHTLAAFIRRNHITATSVQVENNPHMDSRSQADMTHYKVLLSRPRHRMTVLFSLGLAHTNPPDAAMVLDCLASDASSADQDFESWAADYGYDTDSRSAERTYQAVISQTRKLRTFLGPELFDELVWHTERE